MQPALLPPGKTWPLHSGFILLLNCKPASVGDLVCQWISREEQWLPFFLLGNAILAIGRSLSWFISLDLVWDMQVSAVQWVERRKRVIFNKVLVSWSLRNRSCFAYRRTLSPWPSGLSTTLSGLRSFISRLLQPIETVSLWKEGPAFNARTLGHSNLVLVQGPTGFVKSGETAFPRQAPVVRRRVGGGERWLVWRFGEEVAT